MSLNVFKNKTRAKTKSIQILLLFIAVVLGMPLVLMLLGALLLPRYLGHGEALWVGCGISLYVVIVSIKQYYDFKDSPFSIIESFRALHISENLFHPLWQRYRNVAEEQAIAAQIDLPNLYVFKHDQINALVVGTSKQMSTVLVSTGALALLNREELAGLIAHEYGHIINGDIGSNLLGLAAVKSLRSLNEVGWMMVFGKHKDNFNDSISTNAANLAKNLIPIEIIYAIPLWIIGSFGALVAKWMQRWLCRSQEYLADASSVQFTRNNTGLAGVLAKAFMQQNFGKNLFYLDHTLMNFAHMTFNGMSFSKYTAQKFSWLDTHPPLSDRIERISPGFLRRFKVKHRDHSFLVSSESLIFPPAKQEPLLAPEEKAKHFNIMTLALFSTDATENLWQLSFNQFINELALSNDSIDEDRLKYWETELAKVPQLILIDLRLQLVDGIKKASAISLLGQINLANIVCMMSDLIGVKNGSETVLREVQLSNQLAHVLSAFAKLAHQDKNVCQAAYVEAKKSYPFIQQDKMPLNIIRLAYDLVLLSRLSTKDQQKLLSVVGKMIHKDGVVSLEEKSLSILLFRVLS